MTADTAYGRTTVAALPWYSGCSRNLALSISVQLGPFTSRVSRTMAVPPQLKALLLAVNTLLRKRRYHAVLAVLKGFRNGAV